MRKLANALLIGVLSAACAASETPLSTDPAEAAVASQLGQPFDLRPGQTARVGDGGLVVGFRGVANDSRCAVDVQCVWAGDAEVHIPVTVGRASWTNFSLHTGVEPRSATFQSWRITLVELKPAPRSNVRISSDSYVVTLQVE
jgi:hypothetical protein